MEAARKSDEAREQLAAAPTAPPEAAVPAEIERVMAAAPAGPLPGAAPQPKVEEMLVCSGHGEVLYQWQCRNVDVWVNFFEFVSQRGQWLAQALPLGEFDRLEVESAGARTVVIIAEDRGVLVKSRREVETS
jgi:hypothetical protein